MDHRLVRDGHLDRMSLGAAALYLFLVAVGDAEGLSYYSDDSVCRRLGLSHDDLATARSELVDLDLVAYKKPLYQILEISVSSPTAAPPLPPPNQEDDPGDDVDDEPEPFPQLARLTPEATPMAVKDIFRKIMEGLS